MQTLDNEIYNFTVEKLAIRKKSFDGVQRQEPVLLSSTERLARLLELLPQVDRFERLGKTALRCGFRGEMLGIGRFAVVGRAQKADFGGFAMRALLIAIAKMVRVTEHLIAAGQHGRNDSFTAEIADMERRKIEVENLIRRVVLGEGKKARRRDINSLVDKTNLFSLCENSLRELADLWPREYREAMESFEQSAKRNAQLLSELDWLSPYGEPLTELSKKFVGKEFRDLAMMQLGYILSQNDLTKEAFCGDACGCGVDGALKNAYAFDPYNLDLAQVIKLRDKLAVRTGLPEIQLELSESSCLELPGSKVMIAGDSLMPSTC